jgi:SAM-dependent methyltransferase
MEYNEFIEQLRDGTDPGPFIEMDRQKEYEYMRKARMRFQKAAFAMPVMNGKARILDIGPTPFTLYFKTKYPNYDVYALDRSIYLKERFARYNVELRVCDLDDESLPFDDGFFDAIVFMEVLEHVFRPPSEVLTEVLRLLRPGGKLIMTVPNIVSLRRRMRMLGGRSPLPRPDNQLKKDWVHGHGHIHEYDLLELVEILQSVGFEIDQKKHLRFPMMDALQNTHWPPKKRLTNAVYRAAQAFWPSLGCFVYVVCHKRASA